MANGIGRVGWRSFVSQIMDVDALAFITAANITDTTQQSAINTLVTQLKTYGIWSKMKAIYPFVGGSSNSHKFNLKDPRDLDASYRLVFNGGWTHTATGVKPNGTNAYADTFFIPSTNLGAYSVHLSYYSRTNRTYRNSIAIGAWQDAPTHNNIDLRLNGNNAVGNGYSVSSMFDGWNGLDYASYATTRSDYFLIGSKTAINLNKVYENGVLKGTNTTTSTKSIPNVRVLIGAEGRGTTGASNYDNLESAFASIGDGLTDTEASNLYTAVQTFQTTLGRQVGVPIVADSDAQAFLNAAVITDQTQASAINTLVTSLKSSNIWSKMKAIYPFVGGSSNSHKFNLKDPRDLDAAYRLVFNGGWTHTSNGALPNGTNAFADTKLNPTSSLLLNDNHLSFYSRTNNTSSGEDIGVRASSDTRIFDIEIYWAGNSWYQNMAGFTSPIPITNTSGLFLNTRVSNTGFSAYRNTTLTNISQNSVGLPNGNIYLGSNNLVGTGAYHYSNRQVAFSSIGDGLSNTDALNFYNIVQTYQTTLGRQV